MNTPVLPHVPTQIAAYMRAAAGRRAGDRTGPFTVGLDAHSADPMRNYAVPDHGACPDASEIDALITFFRRSNRVPRLEYTEEDAPGAWPALAAAGFTLERRTPVMTAIPGTRLTPRSPAGTSIRLATSAADLTNAAAVAHHAYQLPDPPAAHDIARLTRLTERGGLVAIAIDDSAGTVTGTGLIDVAAARTAPDGGLDGAGRAGGAGGIGRLDGAGGVDGVDGVEGVGELAAVGVLAAFRGRGIASALSAYLARSAHSRGIHLVFLEAEPTEEQLYRRTGFTDATTKIWASLR
jgi:ribosomal protein S18 acetylase RimI-like enzyme